MMKNHRIPLLLIMSLFFLFACRTAQVDHSEQNEPAEPYNFSPGLNLIPDAELVYGPALGDFNVRDFIEMQAGYLADYSEEVGETCMSGAQIVEYISLLYSVNPRLLLAVLEYRSHWVSEALPEYQGEYPINAAQSERDGLFRQLSWAANELNRGFYIHEAGALGSFNLPDGTVIDVENDLNHASAALQYFFGLFMDQHDWELAVSPLGLYTSYMRLFGDPFQFEWMDLYPADLQQPVLQLPFAQGERWHFTSGPHSAWGDGAGWAALDFSPPGEGVACYESDAWVRAAADGRITYAQDGAVLLDLDGDGNNGTGWVLLYMHIASDGRVQSGTMLQAGDAIGHPSCEGGISSGTHVHIARRYNGVWVSADRDIPFVMSGWISRGTGAQYEGELVLNDIAVEASGYVTEDNEIYW